MLHNLSILKHIIFYFDVIFCLFYTLRIENVVKYTYAQLQVSASPCMVCIIRQTADRRSLFLLVQRSETSIIEKADTAERFWHGSVNLLVTGTAPGSLTLADESGTGYSYSYRTDLTYTP